MAWETQLVLWSFKCKCKTRKGQYRITPIGVVGGGFPKFRCPSCKTKWSKKTAKWATK